MGTASQVLEKHLIIHRPTDKMVALAYLHMDHEQLSFPDGSRQSVLETVFYQGIPELKELINDSRPTYACFDTSRPSDKSYIGVGWISKVEQLGENRKKAEVGFAFWGNASVHTKVAMGRKMIQDTFDNYAIDVLFGTTPTPNTAALAYAKRLGFSVHGPIPDFCIWRGGLCGAYVTHLNKEDFDERP